MVSLEERYEHLEKTIRGYNISADFAQIRAAYEYARDHHGDQLRRDGTPYITHPLQVAQIVAEMRLDSESIIAALLHDCIEDTDSTYEDIAKRFSSTVADIVDGVTKLTRVQYSTMEEEQMENLRKMLFAMSKDIRVILIKIADGSTICGPWSIKRRKSRRKRPLRPWRSTPPSPTASVCRR